MKNLITFVSILLICTVCYAVSLYPSVKIIRAQRDNAGLLHVTAAFKGDTTSYKYLNDLEFITLVNTGNPYSN